jgi:hypothetical protein
MATIGCYRGIRYAHLRLCDVFDHMEQRQRWWFVMDDSGRIPTGDHFRTQRELKEAVDSGTGSILPNGD